MSLEQEMVVAFRAGVHAARAGKRIRDNPFNLRSRSVSDRLYAKLWVRGYGKGNPVVDEFDVDLDELEEVKATIVHVPAHTRKTKHGVEQVDAYSYDRETGKRIIPTPRSGTRQTKGVTIQSI